MENIALEVSPPPSPRNFRETAMLQTGNIADYWRRLFFIYPLTYTSTTGGGKHPTPIICITLMVIRFVI